MTAHTNPVGRGSMRTLRKSLSTLITSRAVVLTIVCTMTAAVSAMAYSAADDRESLQGKWRVLDARAKVRGENAPIATNFVARGTISFVGREMIMRDLGNEKDSSSTFVFTLDTTASPHRIAMVGEGSSEGNNWSGIYRLSGDTLQLALPIEHFSDRPVPPADFGASNTMGLTLERERH